MPLYEYQCESCGRFELIRKHSDPPLETCPTCGKPVQKLLSAPAFQFKGTGWYVTDYARKGSGGEGGGKGGESKGGDSGKDGGEKKDAGEKKSGDSKPADTKSTSGSGGTSSSGGSSSA